jgi:hypothetical protein
MSDDIKDIDLLDMFSDEDKDKVSSKISDNTSSGSSSGSSGGSGSSNMDGDSILGMLGSTGNIGSGDVTEDLMNWFKGDDKLPSDPLVEFLNSASLKVEFGMMFNMIKNFARLKKLQDFVDQAEEVYFDPNEIINLEPDELKERMKFASDIMSNMFEMNRKTIMGMKKKNDEEDMDKLKLLLSAIPSNKLKDIITNLTTK